MKLRYSEDSMHDLLLRHLQDKTLDPCEDAPDWMRELSSSLRDDLGLLALHGISGLSEKMPEQTLQRIPEQQAAVRIPLCPADNVILHLTHDAIRHHQHLALAVPPGATMMPLLMVCKALLGDLLEQHEALGASTPPQSLTTQGGVLLVSPEVELRSRYFSMRVEPENVVETYPACRMRPDGTVTAISSRRGSQSKTPYSVCFFLARQKQLPSIQEMQFTPAVVILDLMHDHWMGRLPEIIEWCLQLRNAQSEQAILIALFPLGDKSIRDTLAAHEIVIFPFGYYGLRALNEHFESSHDVPSDRQMSDIYAAWSFDPYVAEKPLEREHTVYFVSNQASDNLLQSVASIYSTLDSVRLTHPSRDLRLAGWLVGTLMQLPIPVQWYEQHAFMMGNRQRLKALISSIGDSSSSERTYENLGPVLQSLRGQLDLLYMRLSDNNPKSDAFLRYYHEHLETLMVAQQQTLLLARNDVVARALWPWLLSEGASQDQQPFLRVLPYRRLDGRLTFDHAVAMGPWPTRYRWQIGGRLAKAIDFLLYPGEEPIVQQQMAYFYGSRARAAHEQSRLNCLERFGDIKTVPHTPDQHQENQALMLNITVPPMSSERALSTIEDDEDRYDEDEVDLTLKSLFPTYVLDPLVPARQTNEAPLPSIPVESLRPPRWVEDAEEDHDAMDASEQTPLIGATIPCVLLTVQQVNAKQVASGTAYIYLSADGATECFVPGQNYDELTSIANDEIEPGYVLIRTDEDDRQSLFDRVIQLADAQPTMKYLKVWRDYWLEAISSLVPSQSSGRARRGTYQQLRRLLIGSGVRVTEATIRGWVLGERIGPASIESVRGVAKLSGHPMLLQYPEQVDAAFKQIRTIHQVLGRRISAMLQALGKTVRQEAIAPSSHARRAQRDVHLDPALAVPIDDLIDLLEFFEVINVDVGPWEVPTSREGVILGAPLYGSK